MRLFQNKTGKIKCERDSCNEDSESIVTTNNGGKKFLCKKHGQNLMKTLASIKIEKLER